MSLHHKIRLIAGAFILISLALGLWVSPWWLLFTAFVGVNLIQSAVTRWCLMEDILRWTGIHREEADVAPVDRRARPV
ncbi:MAG TPA: DUF2892 domain-containing protein [Longimicrobiales bacterium]|nr:DUF2892 domain-containing protein [Longimicrobiales bacterium]